MKFIKVYTRMSLYLHLEICMPLSVVFLYLKSNFDIVTSSDLRVFIINFEICIRSGFINYALLMFVGTFIKPSVG